MADHNPNRIKTILRESGLAERGNRSGRQPAATDNRQQGNQTSPRPLLDDIRKACTIPT
jgi:hypothetical protein